MRDREAIIPMGIEALYEKIPYAPAVRVGRTIYVLGQMDRDENLRKVLKGVSATMTDIVDLTSFRTDARAVDLRAGEGPLPHQGYFGVNGDWGRLAGAACPV